MRIIVAAGGTGGHIVPALALVAELERRGHEVLVVGGERDRRFDAVLRLGHRHVALPDAPLYRTNIVRNAKSALRFARAVARARALLRAFRPDACVGLGGYATGPVLLAARFARVPYVVCEQNAYPGFANRRFAGKARVTLLNHEAARAHLPRRARARAEVVGNPVRGGFGKVDRKAARRALGIPAAATVLGVSGGSQGSAALNTALGAFAPRMARSFVLWSAGATGFTAAAAHAGERVRVFPFVEDMDAFLAACDLVVSRAGATSLAELAASGVPAVLVPYPHAAGDHQRANARSLAEAGAAAIVEEGEGFAGRLEETVRALLKDKKALARMAKAMKKLHRPDALARMADHVEAAGRGDGRKN